MTEGELNVNNEGDINTSKMKLLKLVVVSMGVLLIVGTAALFGLIAYKLKNGGSSAPSVASGACKGGNYKISVPGQLSGAGIDGTQTMLLFTRGGEKELVILDHCTGAVVSRLTIGE